MIPAVKRLEKRILMGLNDTAKNAMLDHLVSLIGYGSLHSADPGAGGANELAGGTPAYARIAAAWAAASGGSVALSGSMQFDVEAGDTVAYVGLWSAITGGTFYGSDAVTNETFGGQGTYTVTSGSISVS